MDLMHDATFRVAKLTESPANLTPGIYRVIVDAPEVDLTVVVLIQSEEDDKDKIQLAKARRGGRKKKQSTKPTKPRAPLVGGLLWLDRKVLEELHEGKLLQEITIERDAAVNSIVLNKRGEREYAKHKEAMSSFLDFDLLREHILGFRSIAGLVKGAMSASGVSRGFVYEQWSNLCKRGFDEKSLIPRHDRAGAPGVARRVDPGGRKKAGRKTTKQRIAMAYGVVLESEQPAMSSEWAERILTADKQIPAPKPSWPERCNLILTSSFVAKAQEKDGKIELIKPAMGTYPLPRQIRRLLETETHRLARVIEKTTKAHFEKALRGLTRRSWEGVSGPGHTWAIDSTVGDLYLRSSINRAWIVGRPIVYVLVDVWSTAVVGFYVCLAGPSWATAKVSLFNASADPALIGDLWGYTPVLSLEPHPTLCFSLLCDRGEYLSLGHRATAIKLIPLTSYAPPYRGDLKHLAEVLHRIEKDAQFPFVPGAMDFRRQEMELRKVDPADCVMTVREYVQFLYEVFTRYNLTADRTHRLDPFMVAAGVVPSPAGLWHYGHAVGIGYRRKVLDSDLITNLLPSAIGRVRRDAVVHAGNDYMSEEVRAAQWTAIARNLGGWDIPLNYYPGSFARIWTPATGSTGVLELQLSDQSRASRDITYEDWEDAQAVRMMNNPSMQHLRTMHGLDYIQRINAIIDGAKALTKEAIDKASGAAPTMKEARIMEQSTQTSSSPSESKTVSNVQQDAMDLHQTMMTELLRMSNEERSRAVA